MVINLIGYQLNINDKKLIIKLFNKKRDKLIELSQIDNGCILCCIVNGPTNGGV